VLRRRSEEDIVAVGQLKHRGHRVTIGGTDRAPSVTIGNVGLPVSEIAPGIYASPAMPYKNFSSVEDLVRAVIDHAPMFHGKRDI
jgi:hypothetical protein